MVSLDGREKNIYFCKNKKSKKKKKEKKSGLKYL